jgi:hypothetical protein
MRQAVEDREATRQFDEAGSGERIREQLREEIRDLDGRIDAAQADLESATGSEAEDLTATILRLGSVKALKEGDLKLFDGVDEPPLTDPRVLGWEATQGLVEYELVAGKDTLVRVFVSLREIVALPAAAEDFDLPSSFHFEGAEEFVSRLDYASLEVSAPNGSRFRVPATMSGKFGSPSMSEEDNVNFYIAGDQLSRTGTYEFVARFYRDGELVGTTPLGTREFLATGDFRLLIKVNTWPMSDAGWDTVLRALDFLQRNLPVRAGVAPMDSDVSAGLRYFIDPRPYDPGFSQDPQWANAKLALAVFNLTQNPFGSGDRAHMVMNVREQQPNQDFKPGAAEGPPGIGKVLGVQLRTDPPGDDFFAAVVSQEIGHNLIPIKPHTLDPIIPTASGFDLLNRRTLPVVRTVMFNPINWNLNENSMFEPDHWSKMRNNLIDLNT